MRREPLSCPQCLLPMRQQTICFEDGSYEVEHCLRCGYTEATSSSWKQGEHLFHVSFRLALLVCSVLLVLCVLRYFGH